MVEGEPIPLEIVRVTLVEEECSEDAAQVLVIGFFFEFERATVVQVDAEFFGVTRDEFLNGRHNFLVCNPRVLLILVFGF